MFFCHQQHFEIPEEEAEWMGLSLEEAVEKQRQLEHKVTKSSYTAHKVQIPSVFSENKCVTNLRN